MKRMFPLFFILIFVTTFAVIAEEHVQATQETSAGKYTSPADALLKATLDKFGNSRSSVVARIGKPLSMSSEFIAKADKPLQDDMVHTLTYDGIVIRIYHSAAINKEKLLSLRMTKNRKELFPELIGKSEKDVIAAFGQPTSIREGKIEYDTEEENESGLGVIELEFKNSSVVAVELTFYID
jgi:hypothetical protein